MTIENMITVDVEDWYHICGVSDIVPENTWQNLETRIHQNISRLLQILAKRDVRATFFALGYIAEKYPEVIQKIQK
ncbi:MAG: polysaccharide deacetylase family protein, partial [Desulfobacterales bacterium]|nr:polysaccharide deacetylase family protein [Desulfobacterales bacterium]